jgi:hypothetical protein
VIAAPDGPLCAFRAHLRAFGAEDRQVIDKVQKKA